MVHAPGCRPAPQQQRRRGDSHEHGHSHGSRRQVERAACEAEGHPRPGSAVHEALRRLAVAKGLVSASQLRQTVESLETARYKLRYKLLVAALSRDVLTPAGRASRRTKPCSARRSWRLRGPTRPSSGGCSKTPTRRLQRSHVLRLEAGPPPSLLCASPSGGRRARHLRVQPERADAGRRGRERCRHTQFGRVHALLLLPRFAPRTRADVVQVGRLPRARGAVDLATPLLESGTSRPRHVRDASAGAPAAQASRGGLRAAPP